MPLPSSTIEDPADLEKKRKREDLSREIDKLREKSSHHYWAATYFFTGIALLLTVFSYRLNLRSSTGDTATLQVFISSFNLILAILVTVAITRALNRPGKEFRHRAGDNRKTQEYLRNEIANLLILVGRLTEEGDNAATRAAYLNSLRDRISELCTRTQVSVEQWYIMEQALADKTIDLRDQIDDFMHYRENLARVRAAALDKDDSDTPQALVISNILYGDEAFEEYSKTGPDRSHSGS